MSDFKKTILGLLCGFALMGCLKSPYQSQLGDCIVVQPGPGETLAGVAEKTPAGLANLPIIGALNPAGSASSFAPVLVPKAPDRDLGIRADGYPVVPTLTWRLSDDHGASPLQVKLDLEELLAEGVVFASPDAFLSWLSLESAIPEKSVLLGFEVVSPEVLEAVLPHLKAMGARGLLFADAQALKEGDGTALEMLAALSDEGFELAMVIDSDGLNEPQEGEGLDAFATRVKGTLEANRLAFPVPVRFALTSQRPGSVLLSVLKSMGVSGVYVPGEGGNTIFSNPLHLVRQDLTGRDALVPVVSLFSTFNEVNLSW